MVVAGGGGGGIFNIRPKRWDHIGYTYKLKNKHLEDERCQPHTHLDTVRVVQRFWAPQSGGYLTLVTDEENRGQKIRQNYGHFFLPNLGLFWSFRSSRELPESSPGAPRELLLGSPGGPAGSPPDPPGPPPGGPPDPPEVLSGSPHPNNNLHKTSSLI